MSEPQKGYRIRIGGVLRCCLANDFPVDPKEGDVLPCQHCKDGLRLVARAPGYQGVGVEANYSPVLAWEAAWITLGHNWRSGAAPHQTREET